MTSVERAPNLDALARTIKAEMAAAEADWQSALQHALNAGDALIAAKGECKHGEWLPFLAKMELPDRTARRWMQLARNRPGVADLPTVSAAVAELVQPKDLDPLTTEEVKELETLMLAGELGPTGYTPDEVDNMLDEAEALPVVDVDSDAEYAADADDLAELYKDRDNSGAIRQFVFLYTPESAEQVEADLTFLRNAWGMSATRSVVQEALRRAVTEASTAPKRLPPPKPEVL